MNLTFDKSCLEVKLFSLPSAVPHLRDVALLFTQNVRVEMHEVFEPTCNPGHTLRIRMESASCLAELTVWSSGTTAMQVIELEQDRCVLDRSDVVLNDTNWKDTLDSIFFDRVRQTLAPEPR